ncbi:Methyl-accepting chemotaxis sensor/transducer protein [hydrothermal vent metagenome]|uniref:Methyl-accepting chemotaxis sensor/transducer protein n=1 Tax=hydrothermal vent metagenome TaxID=652676 RepID=A0A3B0ZXB6_9ZZZZ
MKFKPSLLRNLLITFIGFGATIGVIFPFFVTFFVEWKLGMYVWFSISALIAGITIGIANYWLVKVMLLKKLKRIAEIAHTISDKDISHTCTLESHDLIGEIVDSFNQMARTLRDIIRKINEESNQLYSASDALKNLTSEATDGSQQQQSQIEQVATAVNQMAATAQEVARHAEETASATKEANEQSENAKVVVVEAMSSVDVLADMVGNASDVIGNLEKESENIGNVLSVINGIAEQTNLLALNAAIEAARAGDQGRGFAVVADEVRTLATRTQESTKEISSMIERLQTGSREAVATMEKGRDQAQQGVEYTEQAVEALAIIAGNITTINDMSMQIASAAEEQNAVVEDVNRNVVAINDVSVQSTGNINQVDLASNEVAQHAADLRTLVEDFKI